MAPRRLSVAAVGLVLALGGCSSTNSSGAAAPPDFPSPSHHPSSARHTRTPGPSTPASSGTSGSTSTTSPGVPASARITKLLVFIVENHSLNEMKAQMPWTFRLGQQYGYATDFHAISHPSLPNYLAIAGGSTFGVSDDNDPSAHPLSGQSVFGQALASGSTARVYADDMPAPCTLTNAGRYAVRHNPWTYFTAERTACHTFDTPMDRFPRDVRTGRLPNAGMVVPDICDDGHSCPLSTADAWMKQGVGLAMSGPDFRSGRLAIVVTADEDDRSQNNTVLTIVVHPSLHGVVVSSPLSHLSLSRLYSEVLGQPPLRSAATAPSMATAFHLPLAHH